MLDDDEILAHLQALELDAEIGRSPIDESVLKNKYRELAKKYHPDKNQDDPDANAKFQRLNAAYKALSDNMQISNGYFF